MNAQLQSKAAKQLLTWLAVAGATVGVAQATPQHFPAVDQVVAPGTLYSITFYDDTSSVHSQWATQNICFVQGPVQGSNTTGLWYSTTYNRWIGLWRQEGDQIFMIGDFWTGRGKDAMQWELVTTKDEGFGHWNEWVEDGFYGNWVAKGNTRLAKIGTCSQLNIAGEGTQDEAWERTKEAALKAAEAAPVRYRKDGSLAQPIDRDQLPPN
jgi:hypothetical protein